jgi:hypothetical protein
MNNNQQAENTMPLTAPAGDASRGARSNRHENAQTARDDADRRAQEEEKKQASLVEKKSYIPPEFSAFKEAVDLKLTEQQRKKNEVKLHLIRGKDLVMMVDVKNYSKILK